MKKTMKTATNKRAFWFWQDYKRSTTHSVLDAYKTTSSVYKQDAEKEILQEMASENGHSYRILSHSGFVFTCGYITESGLLKVFTRDNVYLIEYTGDYEK